MRRQKQELIEKHQKKAHTVIALIIDGVERKMDSENKSLKRLIFK